MVTTIPQSLDYATLAAAKRDCLSMLVASDSNLSLQLVPFGPHHVLCDVTGHQPRPVIPLGHRRQVFNALHRQAHPGAKATRRLMQERVIWTCMN